MSGGAVALEGIQTILDENTELKTEREATVAVIAEMNERLKELETDHKKFEPFREIIMDEDATKEWKQISFRNSVTYKQLIVRTQQIHGNTSSFSVSAVANSCLEFALGPGWFGVKKMKYTPEEREDGDKETEVADDNAA